MSEFIRWESSVTGDAELKERFAHVGSTLRAKLREALFEAGGQLKSAARGLAPVLANPAKANKQTVAGALRDSIDARLIETLDSMTMTVRPSAFYAQIIEGGAVSHGGRNNKNTPDPWVKGGKNRKRAKVDRVTALRAAGQWRVQPRPFMKPAMASLRSRIDQQLAEAVASSGEAL